MIYRDEETYHIFDDQNNSEGNPQFEYKESYWDDMEAMLDQHDAKKKKRRGFFLMFSSAAAIALVVFGFYNWGDSSVTVPQLTLSDLDNFQRNETVIVNEDINPIVNQKNSDSPLINEGAISNNGNREKALENTTKIKSSNGLVNSKKNQINLKNFNIETLKEMASNNIYLVGQNISNTISESNNVKSKEGLAKLDSRPLNIERTTNNILLEKRKVKFPLKHSLSINTEAGIVNKYEPSNGVSYAVMAGLGYELGFHKNLSFQTGVNLIYRDGVSQEYRAETKVYGFHSTRYYQDVNYKGQFNVEVPISLKVKFKRSSISAGVGASFLLGVRSSVEQYMPESSSVESVKNNFGIKEGVRNMDVNVNLNYAYAVSPNIELTAGVSAGLMDQTDNEFFSNDAKDHNLQFRAGLKYYFFNK
jgi:hypothetical protein